MSRRSIVSVHRKLQKQRFNQVKRYLRDHKEVQKDVQDKINMCIKEVKNPLYKLFNQIRYKLGLLKI